MREIVARVSGRVFVGLPYCKHLEGVTLYAIIDLILAGRNPKYLDVAMNIAIDLSHLRKYLAVVPQFLKPYVIPPYFSGALINFINTELMPDT